MHRASARQRRHAALPAWEAPPAGAGDAFAALGRGCAAYLTDAEGRIVGWNQEAERLLGLRGADVRHQPCAAVMGCRDLFGEPLEPASCPLRLGALWGGPPPGFEIMAHPPGGAPIRLRAASVGTGDPLGGMLVLLQPSAQGLIDARAIETSLERVMRAIDADAAELFLEAPGGGDLLMASHAGAAAKAFRERIRFRPGEGFPGIVAQTGLPLVSTDLSGDPRFLRKAVPRQGILTCLSVPVMGSRLLGTLEVAFRSAHRSPAPVLPFVADVARELAFHLERSRLEAAGELLVLDPASPWPGVADRILGALVRQSGADGGVLLTAGGADGGLGIAALRGMTLPIRWAAAGAAGSVECPAYGGCLHAQLAAGTTPFCRNMAREFRSSVCLPIAEDAASHRPVATVLLGFTRHIALPTARLAFLHDLVRYAARALAAAPGPGEAARGASPYVPGHALGSTAPARSPADAEARSEAAPVPDRILDIRCLGGFQLARFGRIILPEAFKRRRSLTVLKILLARYGKPVHREELMEMLWPEQDPEESRKRLNSAIHYLRRTLSPGVAAGQGASDDDRDDGFIRRDGEFYSFDVASAHRIDTVAFEQAAREGARLEGLGDLTGATSLYRQAICLYRGDFLEEERWSDWCALEREYFRERLLSVLRSAADLHVALGDDAAAEACCRRALQVDPVLEDVHRKLMEVLWRVGRRSEALKQFDECRVLLARELGIEPMSETADLARSIAVAESADPDAGLEIA